MAKSIPSMYIVSTEPLREIAPSSAAISTSIEARSAAVAVALQGCIGTAQAEGFPASPGSDTPHIRGFT